jgi:hypothetical protein
LTIKALSVFRYPLYLESLGVLIYITVFTCLIALASIISLSVSEGAPIFVIGLVAVVLLVATFFEYGLEIMSESCQGSSRPPALSVAMINKGRFGRQLLMIILFGSIVFAAFSRGLDYTGLMLLLFVSATFPASLALNSLYEDLFEIISPVALAGFMVITGRLYVLAILVFALLIAVFYAMALSGIFAFLVFLPFGLYGLLVYFRFLGLTNNHHRSSLLPEKDFLAADRQIQQTNDRNENMHDLLKTAYWELKNRRVDTAINLIKPIIQLGDWVRFDAIFKILSQWPNKQPGLYFIKPYIPKLLERRDAMAALALCEWGLKHDKDFTLENGAELELLTHACVSRQQFIVAVKLLDNFVAINSDHESAARYLSLAADICQGQLRHQKKFDELQEKLQKLGNAELP